LIFKNKPSVFIVAVVGPDGVGKTTSINECKNKLIENKYSFISKHHVWGNLDERPTDNYNLTYFKPLISKDRRNIFFKIYNYLISIMNIIFAEIMYVIKLNNMISDAAKKYDLLLIDRYIYDKISAKVARNNFDYQFYLRKIFTIFVYRPDLCILLSNTPKEIHKRKYELSLVEAKLYLQSIKKIAKNKSSFFDEIFTDKSPNVVGQEMFNSINKFNIDNRFIIKDSK